jgi:hypothetical protein
MRTLEVVAQRGHHPCAVGSSLLQILPFIAVSMMYESIMGGRLHLPVERSYLEHLSSIGF